MLRTALLHRRPVGDPLPARRRRGRRAPATIPQPLEIGTGEILREGERVAIVGYGSGVGWRSAPPTCWPTTGSTSPSPTRASPSRSTRALLAQLAAEHDLLVTVEEGVLQGGFGTARLGGAQRRRPGAAHPARRPARPLRHPRRAGAAAPGGRLHRRGDRRAHRGRRARSALQPGLNRGPSPKDWPRQADGTPNGGRPTTGSRSRQPPPGRRTLRRWSSRRARS